MSITTLALISSVTQSSASFTVGQAFKQGDVPAGLQVVSGLTNFQCTPKNTWPDGSLKFALLSGRTALTANTPLTVDISIGVPATVTALTTTDLKATGVTASIVAGVFGTVSWVTTDWDSPFEFTPGVSAWVSGPQMSSWIYRKPIGSDPHLVGWMEVRLYAGGAVEVLPWIENGYIRVAGPTSKSATYTFTLGGTSSFSAAIDLPSHARTPLVSGTLLSHWLGTDPSVIVEHNKQYLQSTALVPSYGAAVSTASSLITSLPSTYTPMQQGGYSTAMGGTGYQPPIGLLPQWDVLYLTSSAPSVWAALQRNAYSAGRYPIHFRDENTNRPPLFDQFPNFSVNASTISDYPPATAGTPAPAWDVPHHPSLGFMAYLVTGRWFHMETLLFAATFNYAYQVDNQRQFAGGVFVSSSGASTTRGAAWAIRTLVQAATAVPDTDTALRTQLINSLEANIDFNHGRYIEQPHNPFGIVTPYGDAYGTGSDGKVQEAPWQQDFYTMAFGYALALVPPVSRPALVKLTTFFAWKARFAIGRLGGLEPTDWLYRDATPYTMTVAFVDFPDWVGGTGPWAESWGAMYTATTGAANAGVDGGLRGGNFPSATSYWANFTPAIAYAVQHKVQGSATAYARMTTAPNYSALSADFQNAPEWSVVPQEPIAGETMAGIGATTRVDSGNWIAGKTVVGQRGLGILAQNIPSTGTNGAPPIYNDLSFPADNDKEVRWEIVTPPPSGNFFAYEDGSFTYLGDTNTLTYKLWVAGQDMGNATVTLNVGVDATLPIMAGSLTSSAITTSGFTLTWSAASDNIAVTGYEVSINNGTSYTDVGNVLTITETSLAASTLYNTKVRAYDAAGNKAVPLSLAVTTSAVAPDTAVPAMTGSLTASSINSGGFTLSWAAASDNVSVTGYKLSLDNGSTYPVNLGNVLTTTRTGLFSATLYNVKVKAYDAAGNEATPLSLAVPTSAYVDGVVPTMSGSLATSAITSQGFTTTWVAASDDIGVVGYERSVDTGTPNYVSVGNVLTVSKTGLTPETLYYVRVRAFDAAGNRSTAITTTVTTSAIVPTGPVIPQTYKNVTTVIHPTPNTLSSSSKTFEYSRGSIQELVLYNDSGSDVVVNIQGDDVVVPVPEAADDTVTLSGGLNITVTAGSFKLVSLDKCYAYLKGDISITASANDVVTVCLIV
jgi:chitodextrinase